MRTSGVATLGALMIMFAAASARGRSTAAARTRESMRDAPGIRGGRPRAQWFSIGPIHD
jgi:hypothetical protein